MTPTHGPFTRLAIVNRSGTAMRADHLLDLDDEAWPGSQGSGGATRAAPQIRLEVLVEERLRFGRVEAVLEIRPGASGT